MGAPVAGFLPLRAARFETENVPKPTRLTLSPFARAFSTLPRTEFNAFDAAVFVIPASFAAFAISSSFVSDYLLY